MPVEVYSSDGILRDVSSDGAFTVTGTTLIWSYTAAPEPSASMLTALLFTASLLRRRRESRKAI